MAVWARPVDTEETLILLANHCSVLDWPWATLFTPRRAEGIVVEEHAE
jgi:hypothetical protein